MMKKIFLSFAAMLIGSMTANASVQVGNFYYDLNDQTLNATFAHHPNYGYTGDIVIPSTISYNNKTYIVTKVSTEAFGYNSITSLTIPETVTSISGLAFRDEKGLVQLKVKEGNPKYDSRNGCNAIIETATNTLIVGCKNTIIPQSVTAIGNYGFYGCTTLTSINIPEGVTSIGRQAFFDCQKLRSVHIPSTVVSIREEAFWDCNVLSTITVDSNNPYFDSRNKCNAIIETNTNSLVVGCSTTIIPDDVVSIGEFAFAGNEELITISIPNSVQYIEEHAFYGCHHLLSIVIPDGVTTIKYATFSECTGLKEISLPNSINSIERTAFSYCTKLQDFYCFAETVPITDESAFTGVTTNNATLHVPTGTTSLYMNASPWNSFKDIVAEKWRLIARVANKTREYGEDNPQFDIIYSGFVGTDDESVITVSLTVSTNATKTSDVGDYEINISGGEAQNYQFVYEPGILTIIKAPLTAKVNDETRQYGTENPSFSVSYSGLKNDETAPKWSEALNIETTATKQSDAGTYAITATGIPVNYELSIEDGTLTVTPAPLTIKANDATRMYYEEEPTFNYSCNGFVNDDNESVFTSSPILSTTTTLSSNVGDYDITVEGASCYNYSISYVSGTLSITPRTLTASVDNYERQYNEENPVFEVKYEGFVGNENEDVLNEKPTASTTATKTSDVGVYPITISGGSADNYIFEYTPGELTINKAEQSILWSQDLSRLTIGDQIQLHAVATSGMPVTYTIMDNSIAVFYTVGNDVYLDCKKEGQTRIVAVQEGNSNYNASIRVQKSVVVNKESQYVPDVNIDFVDANVKAVCIENWDSNGDGELSYYEASLVKDLGVAFNGNDNITSFEELSCFTGLTSIGESTFDGCSNLVAVSIPQNVTSIGEFAFNSCFALSSITIPSSVTNIGAGAFLSCSSLTTVKVYNPDPCPIVSYTFSNRNNATLYVPYGCEPAYRAAMYWKDFYDIVEMPAPVIIDFDDDNVKAICVENWDDNGDGELDDYEAAKVNDLRDAFKGNIDIMSFDELSYFTGLTSISVSAFDGCNSLISVTIPSNVRSIGDNAFANCYGLTSMTIPSSVKKIGDGVFHSCNSLASFAVEEGNTAYDSREGCNAIIETATNTLIAGCKNTVIPNSVTSIGNSAFLGCFGLTSMIIPRKVVTIGESAFKYCNSLTYVLIPENVTSIGDGAFQGCNSLTTVKVKVHDPLPIVANTFSNRKNAMLIVPIGCRPVYSEANYWKEFNPIKEVIPGDTNSDWTISIADVTLLVDYVMGNTNPDFADDAADVDGDGEITFADAVAIVNIILGKE